MAANLIKPSLLSDEMTEDQDKIVYTVKYYFVTPTRVTSAKARLLIQTAIYDTYEDDKGARAKSISIKSCDEEGTNWNATVTYERPGMSDPMKKEPEITFTSNQYEVPVAYAYQLLGWNQKWAINTDFYPTIPITNSAGDLFNPPLSDKENKIVINIIWNIMKFSPDMKGWYENSINSKDIIVAGVNIVAGYAKMESLDFEPFYYFDDKGKRIDYWKMTTKIELDYRSCIKFLLDAGYNYVKWVGTVPSRTFTKYKFMIGGQSPDHPQLLNGDGEPLDITKLNPQTQQPNQPTYRAYQSNRGMDWKPLSLPEKMTANFLTKG